jgi:hypothetical protein
VVGEDVRLGGGGRGWPAALVIPAAGQLAAVGAAALPAFSAYNSDASVTWKWVASAATIALGFLLIRGVSFLLPDGPAPAGRPARAQHAGGHRNHPLSSGPGYLRPFGPQGPTVQQARRPGGRPGRDRNDTGCAGHRPEIAHLWHVPDHIKRLAFANQVYGGSFAREHLGGLNVGVRKCPRTSGRELNYERSR